MYVPLDTRSTQLEVLQPRAVKVDWNKNGRVTALHKSKPELPVMKNIQKDCSGEEILARIRGSKYDVSDKIRGQSSLTSTPWYTQSANKEDSSEILDWYLTAADEIDNKKSEPPTMIKRYIPSEEKLKETPLPKGEFDYFEGEQKIVTGDETRPVYFISIGDFESNLKEKTKAKGNSTMIENAYTADSQRLSKIQDSLVVTFQLAQEEGAILIFSDLFSDRVSTKIIDRSLAIAKFKGPVFNFSISKSVLHPQTGGRKYSVEEDGKMTMKRQGLLSESVTHSFEVDSEEWNGQTQAALALATAIAGVSREAESQRTLNKQGAKVSNRNEVSMSNLRKKEKKSDIVCILINGSMANLQHVSEAVRLKFTVLVLKGSLRLADSLACISEEISSKANLGTFHFSNELIHNGGFSTSDPLEVSALLLPVFSAFQSNKIIISSLEDGVEGLRRSWASVSFLANQGMVSAIGRRNLYRSAAAINYIPTHVMNFACVMISLSITVISTIQSFLSGSQLNSVISSKSLNTQPNGTDVSLGNLISNIGPSSANPVLHYLVVALPVLLSVLTSLRQDLNYGPKYVAFTYCSAVIDAEVFKYRTRTGLYLEAKRTNDDDAETKSSENLSKCLIEVSACLNSMNIVTPDAKDLERNQPTWLGWLVQKFNDFVFYGFGLVRSFCCRAPVSFDHESDGSEDARISIDDYVENRLKKQARRLHHAATDQIFWLHIYKAFVYIVSASSSILGLLGFVVMNFDIIISSRVKADDKSRAGVGPCYNCSNSRSCNFV